MQPNMIRLARALLLVLAQAAASAAAAEPDLAHVLIEMKPVENTSGYGSSNRLMRFHDHLWMTSEWRAFLGLEQVACRRPFSRK